MTKQHLAFVAGLMACSVFFLSAHLLSFAFFPMAEGGTLIDPASVRLWLNDLPYSAFLIVLSGYALGGLSVGVVSARIIDDGIVTPLLTSVIITAVTAIKASFLGEPLWMIGATLVLIIPFAMLGSRPVARVA